MPVVRNNACRPVISRRSFTSLLAGAALAGAGLLPPGPALAMPSRPDSRLDRLVPEIDPVVDLYNANTKEKIKVRFFNGSRYDMEAVKQINWHLRDWRQKEMVQVDVRLFWALAAIRASAMKAGHSGQIQVNSGYRTKATNMALRRMGYRTADNSLHMKAMAVDFMVPGAKVGDIAKLAEWLEIGGTGIYRNFVHIDSGEIRKWGG